MSELRSRILQACTLQFGGVTGVTHVTEPGPKAKHPSRYARYASPEKNLKKVDANIGPQPVSSARPNWDAADWHAYFEERAAIREYDGGLHRREAEELALGDAMRQRLGLDTVSSRDPHQSCRNEGL
jgi:hypothetical protein